MATYRDALKKLASMTRDELVEEARERELTDVSGTKDEVRDMLIDYYVDQGLDNQDPLSVGTDELPPIITRTPSIRQPILPDDDLFGSPTATSQSAWWRDHPESTPQESDFWLCSKLHRNRADAQFCSACGEAKDATRSDFEPVEQQSSQIKTLAILTGTDAWFWSQTAQGVYHYKGDRVTFTVPEWHEAIIGGKSYQGGKTLRWVTEFTLRNLSYRG